MNPLARPQWYKGNIHTHTDKSDGDTSPERVTGWYRRHGYDFLVLTDHNHLTLLDYGQTKRRHSKPVMIPGEEISVRINNGETAIHLGGIGITRLVEPIDGDDVVHTLQANINAIVGAGGIASINHPNYTWAFDHKAINAVNGASLLEIFNGHPSVNVYGAPGKPSYEDIWDGVLTAGKIIFGVATDDSHHFRDFHPMKVNPGRGWVMVWAEELSSNAIVEALSLGKFYSSTGVTLVDVDLSPDVISIKVEPERDFIYTTRIIGQNGAVFAEEVGTSCTYQIQGDEGYVRAVVTSSSGPKAWTQPVFLSR